MLPKDIQATTQQDLEHLVEIRAQEGPHLDFKRELPTSWDNSAKQELLADVTAFANATGGDIVFGVEEGADAEAVAISPLTFGSIDAEVRRIQDLLMTLSEPRLPGVQVHPIELTVDGRRGHAVIIRVPRSWASPHVVKTNYRVYLREGLRKRPVDVPELRALFLRTEHQAQMVREFRTQRLSKILIGEVPHPLPVGPKLVVHVVPTTAALGEIQVDPLQYYRRDRELPYFGQRSALSLGLNFDGVFGKLEAIWPSATGYSQLFRQGFFETVCSLPNHNGHSFPLRLRRCEEYTIKYVDLVKRELEAWGSSIDVAVFVSLLGANRVVLEVPSELGHGLDEHAFDRNELVFPEVLIPADVSSGRGMKPVFDVLCQSAGLEGSMNYNADGEWAPRT